MQPILFVGCGGTGLRTLARVNKLFSKDDGWRYRLARDVAYVVVDTNNDDLNDFKRGIAADLAGTDKPHVETLNLVPPNVTRLEPLVKMRVENVRSRESRNRIAEHWWRNQEGEFFKGRRVLNLSDGAGQCPPVSFFLAWLHLEEIGEALRRAVEQIQARADSLTHVGGRRPPPRVVLVSSLAGGTGRGCWHLVALKLREIWADDLGLPKILGVFFAGSVFRNVMDQKGHPVSLQIPMNSFTGFSELRCWLGVGGAAQETIEYKLPSLLKPTENCLDISGRYYDTASMPVDKAYLVFRDARGAMLGGHEDYFEMVGGVLYAALSRAELQGADVNEGFPIWGVGSVLVEVPAHELRCYFEELARLRVLDLLGREGSASSAREDASAFLREVGVSTGLGRDDDARSLTAEPEGTHRGGEGASGKTWVHSACRALLKAFEDRYARLEDAMRRDDVRLADGLVQTIEKKSREVARRAAAGAIVEGLGLEITADKVPEQLAQCSESLVKVLQERLGEVLERTGSLAEVDAFLGQVDVCLEAMADALPDPERMRPREEQSLRRVFDDAKDREWPNPFKRFSDSERIEVLEAARKETLARHYGELRDTWRKWISEVRKRLEPIEERVDLLLRALRRAKRVVGSPSSSVGAGRRFEEDVFETLFAPFEEPEKGIPERFSRSRFVKRVLRPPMRRNEPEELIEDVFTEGSESAVPREIVTFLRDKLASASSSPGARSRGRSSDRRDRQIDEAVNRIKELVERHAQLPDRFIEERFSMLRCLERVRDAWEERFNAVAGSRERLRSLTNRFQEFFGCVPRSREDTWRLPEANEILLSMAASVAGACRAHWSVEADVRGRRREPEKDQVELILPVASGGSLDPNIVCERIAASFSTTTTAREITPIFSEESAAFDTGPFHNANPFVMVACLREGGHRIEDIASLGEWRNDAELKQWLADAEDPSGKTVFREDNTNGGLGFVDPIFLKEPFRSLRWRPWAEEEAALAEQLQREVAEALSYALFRVEGALEAALRGCGWSFPLLRIGANQEVRFQRKALLWDRSGKAMEDAKSPWRGDERVAQRIHRAAETLRTEAAGSNRASEWRERILQERDVFWEKVAPKVGLGAGSDQRRIFLQNQEERLGRLLDDAEVDEDRAIVSQMIDAVRRLREGA